MVIDFDHVFLPLGLKRMEIECKQYLEYKFSTRLRNPDSLM